MCLRNLYSNNDSPLHSEIVDVHMDIMHFRLLALNVPHHQQRNNAHVI